LPFAASNRTGQYATRGVVAAVVQELVRTLHSSLEAWQPEAPLSFTPLARSKSSKDAAVDPKSVELAMLCSATSVSVCRYNISLNLRMGLPSRDEQTSKCFLASPILVYTCALFCRYAHRQNAATDRAFSQLTRALAKYGVTMHEPACSSPALSNGTFLEDF
jgi:hypothetical protein